MDAYIHDGAIYCSDCAPEGADGPYPDGGGEADCPQHCHACGVFLGNPLTSEGYAYVYDAIIRYLYTGAGIASVLMQWIDYYAIELDALLLYAKKARMGRSGKPKT